MAMIHWLDHAGRPFTMYRFCITIIGLVLMRDAISMAIMQLPTLF